MTLRPDFAELSACADPDCDGVATPERDGDTSYHECPACGYTFGYTRTPDEVDTANPVPACAVGVSESTRRAASAPARAALGGRGPLLQIGPRPHGRDSSA